MTSKVRPFLTEIFDGSSGWILDVRGDDSSNISDPVRVLLAGDKFDNRVEIELAAVGVKVDQTPEGRRIFLPEDVQPAERFKQLADKGLRPPTLVVAVPSGSDVSIRCHNARFASFSGSFGDLVIDIQGAVELAAECESARIKTVLGAVSIDDVGGQVYVTSLLGSVSVNHLHESGALTVRTAGAFHLDEAYGNLDVRVSNDIDIDVLDPRVYTRVVTTAGDVRCGVPSNVPYNVEGSRISIEAHAGTKDIGRRFSPSRHTKRHTYAAPKTAMSREELALTRLERAKLQAWEAMRVLGATNMSLYSLAEAVRVDATNVAGKRPPVQIALWREINACVEGFLPEVPEEALVAAQMGWVVGTSPHELFVQLNEDTSLARGMPADCHWPGFEESAVRGLISIPRSLLSHGRFQVARNYSGCWEFGFLPEENPSEMYRRVLKLATVLETDFLTEQLLHIERSMDSDPRLFAQVIVIDDVLTSSGGAQLAQAVAKMYPPVDAWGRKVNLPSTRIIDMVESDDFGERQQALWRERIATWDDVSYDIML